MCRNEQSQLIRLMVGLCFGSASRRHGNSPRQIARSQSKMMEEKKSRLNMEAKFAAKSMILLMTMLRIVYNSTLNRESTKKTFANNLSTIQSTVGFACNSVQN
jgi:hypothetical protein